MVGEDATVIALTDRGLESRALFEAVEEVGFHPLMRLKQASATFRPAGWKRFYPLQKLAAVGRFQAAGTLYKSNPQRCTLLIRHDPEHEHPWILATDLPAARPAWYAWRCWIEQGFKDFKRGGFHWQRTRMSDPARVERIWLALSLALLWTLEVGAELEALQIATKDAEGDEGEADNRQPPKSRHHSLTVRGQLGILAVLVAGGVTVSEQPIAPIVAEPPPMPDDPWPAGLPPPSSITEHDFEQHQETYT